MELQDSVIAVTGAAGFLGRAIAGGLGAKGARLALLDRDADAVKAAAEDSGGALAIDCDLTDEAAVNAAVARVTTELGPIQALVNAVGWIYSKPLTNIFAGADGHHGLDDWRKVIDANLTAPFAVGAAVAQTMIRARTRGVIINVSSVSAGGVAGQSAYSAAKSGLNTMSRVWAQELGPMGIRCVAVAPGFIDVPTTHEALGEKGVEARVQETALRRLGTMDETVSAILFALENDFVTDTVLEVDGGIRA